MAMMLNQKPSLHSGSQKCHPDPKGTANSVKYEGDVSLVVFFFKGVVHHEFLPCSHTIKKEYYLEVMEHLQEAVRSKRPNFWRQKRCMFP